MQQLGRFLVKARGLSMAKLKSMTLSAAASRPMPPRSSARLACPQSAGVVRRDFVLGHALN